LDILGFFQDVSAPIRLTVVILYHLDHPRRGYTATI
jgi:hypothetical protein